jgi:hypothetical protein
MTRLGRRKAWLVGGLYSYWSLFIASWWVWLSSSQNEAWFDAFSRVAEVVFFPLVVATFGLCRLAWGSLNIFQAHVVVGLLADVAVVSLLTVSALALFVVLRKSPAQAPPDQVRV